MATNCDLGGESVYCRDEFQKREGNFLYCQVRSLVRKHHPGGKILDLGCSDLVASKKLMDDGYDVVGLDLCPNALIKARKSAPASTLVLADVINLPFVQTGSVGTILLLDIIEHLKDKEEAVNLLVNIRKQFVLNSLIIIVTLPVISFTLPCIKEALLVGLNGRPETGLFDRTHNIFLNQAGHRSVFAQAGFEVIEESHTENIPGGASPPARIYRLLAQRLIPRLMHPLSGELQAKARKDINIYQGLYVLRRINVT